MNSPVVDQRALQADKTSAQAFLRALQPLARTALGRRSLPVPAKNRLATLDAAALAEKMRHAKAHVQAIVALFADNAVASLPASRRHAAVAHLRAMIAKGELLPSGRFVAEIGVTRQALSKAVAARRMFFIEESGERFFPGFFLDPQYQRQQLEQVSKDLAELPGASKLQFFLTKKASLAGLTPLEALAKGKFSRVRDAAAGFASR